MLFRLLLSASIAVSGMGLTMRNSNITDAVDLQLGLKSPAVLLMSGRCELPERLSINDFPFRFVDGHHPEDYQYFDQPIKPEFIVKRSNFQRLILRVSWKVEKKTTAYIPMSFILETRLPAGFYFSDLAYELLSENNRIKYSEEHQCETCLVNLEAKESGILLAAHLSPERLESVNFIGANGLMKFGLILGEPQGGFSFRTNITWF